MASVHDFEEGTTRESAEASCHVRTTFAGWGLVGLVAAGGLSWLFDEAITTVILFPVLGVGLWIGVHFENRRAMIKFTAWQIAVEEAQRIADEERQRRLKKFREGKWPWEDEPVLPDQRGDRICGKCRKTAKIGANCPHCGAPM